MKFTTFGSIVFDVNKIIVFLMNFYVYIVTVLVLEYASFLIIVTSSVTASCALEVRGSRKISGLFVILHFSHHRFK